MINFTMKLTESTSVTLQKLSNFRETINKILNDLSTLDEDAEDLQKSLESLRWDSQHIRYNATVVKSVNKYLHAGSPLCNALTSAADEMTVNVRQVGLVYSNHAQSDKHHRNWMIKKMLTAGYSYREIADLVGVSHNYVYKIKKTS